MKKLNFSQEFLDSISKQVFGMTVAEAIDQSICITCKEKISKDNIYTENGLTYYTANGICDNCNRKFDKLDIPIDILQELQDGQDNMTKKTFGISITDALKKGICVKCRCQALEKCYSDAGRQQYQINGLCEICFDSIYGSRKILRSKVQ